MEIRGILHVSHHQFLIASRGWDRMALNFDRSRNGLVDATSGALIVATGIHTGYIGLEGVTLESPPTPQLDSWEDVVEISVSAPSGELYIISVSSTDEGLLPNLAASGPAIYRIRVHARGRDISPDNVSDSPKESYLLEVWKDELKDEYVLKSMSMYGASLRAAKTGPIPHSWTPDDADQRERLRANLLRRRGRGRHQPKRD